MPRERHTAPSSDAYEVVIAQASNQNGLSTLILYVVLIATKQCDTLIKFK